MNWKPLGIALAAVALAACSSSGKVSVSAQSASASDTTTTSTSGTLDLGNGILVSRVRVAVKRIALEGSSAATPDGGTGGSDDPAGHTLVADHGGDGGGGEGDDDDADEVKVGPFLIDLTGDKLTAGISQVFDSDVPAGTYREIKVVVAPVAAADAGSNTGLADMNGESIIVDGTVDGTAFSFQSTIHVAQKQESTIVVASDGSSSNVTLTVDPKTWFVASDGSRLDPSAAASKSQIEDNIRRSVKAFCDHDRNGEDDGQQHDGAGHH